MVMFLQLHPGIRTLVRSLEATIATLVADRPGYSQSRVYNFTNNE